MGIPWLGLDLFSIVHKLTKADTKRAPLSDFSHGIKTKQRMTAKERDATAERGDCRRHRVVQTGALSLLGWAVSTDF